MEKKVIIFGTSQTAELAHYYLQNDSNCEVAGFTLTRDNIRGSSFRGLPIFAFEDLVINLPQDEYCLFAPLMAHEVNRYREKIFLRGKQLGYSFISYISSKATVLTPHIGENCFILEGNIIQPFVEVGDNVMIWSGNHIGHHSIIESSVFITSHCVISGNCIVKKRAYFGVNSSLVDNCSFEQECMLTMGSMLSLKKTKEGCVYRGNPARAIEKITSKSLLG